MRLIDHGAALLAYTPAKLNLLLSIHGRRPDGFHELETLMIKVSIVDGLRFTSRSDEEIRLQVRRASRGLPMIPSGPENLVMRAAELLRHEAGIRYGADILLEKRIPAEAGLAGGSGNAAATLVGLNRLWQLGLKETRLRELATELGSDVPFFLESANAAVARGRGERLEPIQLPGPLHVVVAKPPFGLPTASVYRAFAEHGHRSDGRGSDDDAGPLLAALTAGRLDRAAALLKNDLMPAAEQLRPELFALRRRLHEECRYGGLMTGSGSACFGLCGSAREATAVAARLRATRAGWVCTATSV